MYNLYSLLEKEIFELFEYLQILYNPLYISRGDLKMLITVKYKKTYLTTLNS